MPDFWISSSNYRIFKAPKECIVKQRVLSKHENNSEMMLIQISPPLSIEEKERLSCEVNELLISARYMGHSLFPSIKFPTVVNVSIPIKAVLKIDDRFIIRTDIGEFYFSFTGELYSNFDDAVKNNLGIDS